MREPIDDATLSAYLDGDLDPEQQAVVEGALATDIALRRRELALRRLVATLREEGAVRAPLGFAVGVEERLKADAAPVVVLSRWQGRAAQWGSGAALAALAAAVLWMVVAPNHREGSVDAAPAASGHEARPAGLRARPQSLEWVAEPAALEAVDTWLAARGGALHRERGALVVEVPFEALGELEAELRRHGALTVRYGEGELAGGRSLRVPLRRLSP